VNNFPPQRIVCLTEETVELLYLLGEEDRIVGVTGYAVRPKIVRKQKPRISSFKSANIQKIIELKPDIVLAFSDIQSEIVANLVKKGQSVLCFNQRDIEGIFNMIQTISSLLDIKQKGINLISKLKNIYNVQVVGKKLTKNCNGACCWINWLVCIWFCALDFIYIFY